MQNFRVQGESMDPRSRTSTFAGASCYAVVPSNGLAATTAHQTARPNSSIRPSRPDIVVFHIADRGRGRSVKRVVGLPDETVEMRRAGVRDAS